jgi:hypothetical protein
MAKQGYLPKTDSGKVTWLKSFSANLSQVSTALDIPQADIQSAMADAALFEWAYNQVEDYKNYQKQRTQFKTILRDGPESEPITAAPLTPPTSTAPPLVQAGIFARIGRFVQRIKNHKNYNQSIGELLGIEGSEIVFDAAEMKPVIKVELQAGKPNILWTKGNATALDIYVDRNDEKGFVFLATDTEPDYLDTYQLPTTIQSAIWKYKTIYKIGDEQVGQWSDMATVAVGNESV